jgi:hypothetical protein
MMLLVYFVNILTNYEYYRIVKRNSVPQFKMFCYPLFGNYHNVRVGRHYQEL